MNLTLKSSLFVGGKKSTNSLAVIFNLAAPLILSLPPSLVAMLRKIK